MNNSRFWKYQYKVFCRMNCSNCHLLYTKQRKPLVYSCGHTFCSDCVSLYETSPCLICQVVSKPAINYAILQHIAKKNSSNIDKYIKLCLFGNMDVGKSSLLKRLIDDQFEYKTNPTIGIDFKFADKEVSEKTFRFQIWDSAGQERYRAVSSNHLKGADIILLVYDLSMPPKSNQLTYWIKQIMNYSVHTNIILIGNKTDLVKQNSEQVTGLTEDQQKFVIEKQWQHIKVSCLNRQNIDQLWKILYEKSKKAKGKTGEQKHQSVILNNPYRQSLKSKEAISNPSNQEGSKCC